MKIVVAIKQVPARDSQLRIASSSRWIEEADLTYEINEPDAYALEAGLQLKEKNGGEVIALCAGPARGTIFSVNRGIKGSRVAVVEGVVLVDFGNNTTDLTAGEQATSSATVNCLSAGSASR